MRCKAGPVYRLRSLGLRFATRSVRASLSPAPFPQPRGPGGRRLLRTQVQLAYWAQLGPGRNDRPREYHRCMLYIRDEAHS